MRDYSNQALRRALPTITEQAREVFREDQIQLIGIETRVFANRTAMVGGPKLRKRLASFYRTLADAARQVGISISRVSHIWPESLSSSETASLGSHKRVLIQAYTNWYLNVRGIGRKPPQDGVRQTLPDCFPSLVTTTTQPLWKPAQPQSEQRHLISVRSRFFFPPWFFGKTIFSESHPGQRSILPGMKVSLYGLRRSDSVQATRNSTS